MVFWRERPEVPNGQGRPQEKKIKFKTKLMDFSFNSTRRSVYSHHLAAFPIYNSRKNRDLRVVFIAPLINKDGDKSERSEIIRKWNGQLLTFHLLLVQRLGLEEKRKQMSVGERWRRRKRQTVTESGNFPGARARLKILIRKCNTFRFWRDEMFC